MNTLQDIFGMMLKKYEDNPNLTIEEIVEKMRDNQEINPDTYENIVEALATLDEFDEKSRQLASAKEEGLSRQDWLQEELTEATKPLGDKGNQFIRKLTKGLKNLFTNVN